MVMRPISIILLILLNAANASETTPNALSFQIMTEIMDPFQVMENGKVQGRNTVFVRDAFARAGLSIPHIDVYPWPRAFKTAQKNGNRFIFPIVRTTEREPLFKWVGKIAESSFYLYGLKDNNEDEILTLEDAKTHEIAIMKDDVAYNYFISKGFEEGKNLRVMSDRRTVEKLFFNQRLEIIISSPFLIKQQAKVHGKDPENYEPKFHLQDLTIEFYLAASPSTHDELIKALKTNWPQRVIKN